MELLLIGVFAFGLYLFVRFVAGAASWLTGRRYRAYHRLAGIYGGRYENRGLSDPPTVSFNHNGSTVRVGLAPQVAGQPSGPRTRVVARFPKGLPFRLELAPVYRSAPPQPPRGTRPVRVGEPEFDRSFFIQANDPEMARDFLGPSVREAILALQKLGPAGGMLVSINPERILIQVDRNLGMNPDALHLAVREAIKVHDGLLLGVNARIVEGVTVVEAGSASPEEAGLPVCKVCLQEINGGQVILCATCKAPHHRDCWEYLGTCSIFGCRGKQGVPA